MESNLASSAAPVSFTTPPSSDASLSGVPLSSSKLPDTKVFSDFVAHCDGHRTATDVAVGRILRARHPEFHIADVEPSRCNLFEFAKAGHAEARRDHDAGSIEARQFVKSRKSTGHSYDDDDKNDASSTETFARYTYRWQGKEFIVYVVSWDHAFRGTVQHVFVLHKRGAEEMNAQRQKSAFTDELIKAVSLWCAALHEEVYVFDSGMWTKSRTLWGSVQKATWDEVILDGDMKKTLIGDVEGFFNRKSVYEEYGVPWKRGVIFHGQPGNGKTMSIKALMRSLSERPDNVSTLYVKSFQACQGDQYSIKAIFAQARVLSPSLLIFEDLDSLVKDDNRSYFLNEVDGIESNDGIMMIGSTNYLGKLDPAIAKRPSRFDRKYHFPLPAEPERVAYCEHWRRKLGRAAREEIPAEVFTATAKITEGFSFAYLKELFVSALLVVVGDDGKVAVKGVNSDAAVRSGAADEGDELAQSFLWRVLKKQVQVLRGEMGTGGEEADMGGEKGRGHAEGSNDAVETAQ
ncbi:MAG: hypothetical protein M1817_006869 [Caeruleum heppii]|nr:MAG: hypothetical protein M1817_006869 [Caeruleum heppii]